MANNPLPGDMEDIDFAIDHEEWNSYELKDGVKIKGRLVVTRFSRKKNSQPSEYGLQTQNIFVVSAPDHLKGPPSTPPPNPNQNQMFAVEVKSSNEIWNVYHLLNTGDRIKVKLVATEVFRVKDIYDQIGQPYYIITSGIMFSPVAKGIKS